MRHAVDDNRSVQPCHALDDALNPEMAAVRIQSVLDIKPASVVLDGKSYACGCLPSAYVDMSGFSVPDGVDGELADHAENRMNYVVAEISGSDGKID